LVRTLAIILAALACSQAQAINKCTDANGSIVFQDAPCTGKGSQINVRPASGHAPNAQLPTTSAPQDGASTSKPMTEAQRIERAVKASKDGRRKQALETRLIPDIQYELDRHNRACDADIANLRQKKGLARNNLAGATWEESISSEMNAIALRCDSKTKDMRERLADMKKECAELGGCQ